MKLFLLKLVVVMLVGVSAVVAEGERGMRDAVPQGLAKSDWQSIRAAYEAGRHAFEPVEGGWQARNPGQQWTTKFDGCGFLTRPRDGDWSWGLELKSYGVGDLQTLIHGKPAVKAEGQNLSYQWDSTVQEWWKNDQRGLEHGYMVRDRPHGDEGAELGFSLQTRGNLTPQVSPDALGVFFQDGNGVTVVDYTGLKVWDADGKMLASRFAAGEEMSLRLWVDDRGARYPITIDPIAQQAYVKGSNSPTSLDQFGASVAAYGDTVVVGVPNEDSSTTGINSVANEKASEAGAAYVFIRSGATWSQQAYLKANNTSANDFFGTSVSIEQETIMVGAPREDTGATDSGAAYVFTRSGTVWSQQAMLKATGAGANDQFGYSLAYEQDTAVVGAPFEDSSTTGVNSVPNDSAADSGAVYVFTRAVANWSQQAYVKPTAVGAAQAGDTFGFAVAYRGGTLMVGAPGEDSSTTGVNTSANESALSSGAAYVFTGSGSSWNQDLYLKANNSGAGDQFGWSVAASDSKNIIVGAPFEDSGTTGSNSMPDESMSDAGAAYVFAFTTGGFGFSFWSQQAYLKAGNSGAGDQFGRAVAFSSNTVAVGAPTEAAAYVFLRSGSQSPSWSQQAYIRGNNTSSTAPSDQFGQAVALIKDTLVVGAPLEDSGSTIINGTPDEAAGNAGACYAFTRSGQSWTQQAYLKPDTLGPAQAGDGFGISVAVDGNTVVVGAPLEDSGSLGTTSVVDETSTDAGAAYVFFRSGTTWVRQAYLKPSNTDVGDRFGSSVAVSGNTIVVGATREDSSTTGVNSVANENGLDSGAAYVFLRSGTAWSQQAYLKASNTGGGTASVPGDRFGASVGIAADTVIIGAPLEDSNTTAVNSISNNSATDSGAGYVFTRSGATWNQQAYLKPAQVGDTQAGDHFGAAVAASGNYIVIGAPLEDGAPSGVSSSASPIDLSTDSGAAYVFENSTGAWIQQVYLKESGGTADGNQFGSSVAISDPRVMVGAPFEDSSSTGSNSTANDGSANAGAAFLFIRSGAAWSQKNYMKASNTGSGDNFGSAVAISGDVGVVGAPGEDSISSGINSEPNESASNAGAIYIFNVPDIAVTVDSTALTGGSGSISFGSSNLAVSLTKTFTITNTGQSTLSISSISGGTSEFVVAGLSGNTIPVGSGTVTFTVTFTPSAGGLQTATLLIASNDPDEDPFSIVLTGSGLAPDIEVTTGGSANIPVTDNGSTINYGNLVVGNYLQRSFTIKNVGTADLTGISITGANADFSVSTVGGTSIPVGTSTVRLIVNFQPTAAGLRSTTLLIASNDPDESPFRIRLAGTGLSIFSAWASTNGVANDPNALGANGSKNLINFASGLNPSSSQIPALQYSLTPNVTVTPGLPTLVANRNTFNGWFIRREDYILAGLTYTPQFSSDLSNWTDATTTPQVLAADGSHQVLSVPFPLTPSGNPPRFFRVKLDHAR